MGRPKGSPNKATVEVRAIARRLIGDQAYRVALKARLLSGDAGPIEQVLWFYAYGKPVEKLQVDSSLPAVSLIVHESKP